ncbi:MAG TPA: glycoside hydrolase family 15 protein [Nevskia sp.]|nr:glycoside hydrolase family 15 protein [Nevskia sp.]
MPASPAAGPTLDLGVIGNCAIGALVDGQACLLWCCLPRFDGDPVFHALLHAPAADGQRQGCWSIELEGQTRAEQAYRENTAILVTRLHDGNGGAVEVVDFAPRFETRGRMFRPLQLVRRLRPLSGAPRVRIRLLPRFDYGGVAPQLTHGSNHIRYVGPRDALRLTTSAPVTYVLAGTPFLLEEPVSFLFGPDEPLREGVEQTAAEFEQSTERHWREWVRRLALPLEWQDAVIRAAITLKLCSFEETGAIVAALTTSIPEAPGTQRNWDYRYCWLRDAFFVVRALNRLAEVETMEHYLRYLANLIVEPEAAEHLQPVFGIGRERALTEYEAPHLAGYRGMGPVRVGNQACEHRQHDVYGNVVLAYTQAFFDRRLLRPAGGVEFARLERMGECAWAVHNTPDAGMWELRSRARVHTSSALMCWAACDRLGRIAAHLGLADRAGLWRERATGIRRVIESKAWNPSLNTFTESFGGGDVEAGLLLIGEVGFLPPQDPRYVATVAAVERHLRRGDFLFRYHAADDFGEPETAFNICTFWYIDALIRLERRDEARELFERWLARRNHLGLLSEDLHPVSGELWGNYPQTYSMVGIIIVATRLSRPWSEAA